MWLVVAMLPALTGCGAVAAVGSTLYSTSEAIAAAVKDAMKEPDGVPVEDDERRPGDGER